MDNNPAFGGCTCPCHTDPEAKHPWTCCWPGYRQPTAAEEVAALKALYAMEARRSEHERSNRESD
jgi:hypothetical protein